MTGQQVYCTVYPMESATKATLPSKTTATPPPPPPPPPTTTTTTTTQVTTKKCHHANFPFWQSAETNGWVKSSHLQVNSFQRSEKLAAEILRMSPEEVSRFDGWRAVVGRECEARSIFLVEKESMRKILNWKRSIKWKEIKKKETWFKDTDSFKRFHSMFPKKVWLLSKRTLTWRLFLHLLSEIMHHQPIIDDRLWAAAQTFPATGRFL